MLKILLVEDDGDFAEYLTDMMSEDKGLEMEIFRVANGQEALDRLEKELPDLIISDLMMPEMDGLELLRIIKEKYPDLPAMMLTGFPEKLRQKRDLTRDVVMTLYKPVRKQDLMDAVNISLKVM